MLALRVVVGAGGGLLALAVVLSAMRTVVLPRGVPVKLTGLIFLTTRRAFNLLLHFRRDYPSRDRLMALYAPVTLLLLPLIWLSLTWLGFAALLWAVEGGSVRGALTLSGSSLLTLGFTRPESLPGLIITFGEAALAISVLALLLVTYLPSMYAIFSEREQQVSLLEVRAGAPPSALQLLIRARRIRGLGDTLELWRDWEQLFAGMAESHTSLPALVFFRSPASNKSWVTASGAVLDAAAMVVAVVDLHEVRAGTIGITKLGDEPRVPQAEVCIRAGYLALRHICRQFDLPFDEDPDPADPISISREEFDVVVDQLAEAGVPIRADRDAAWRDWSGWRVNYDTVLLHLARLTVAPPTPWITDRSPVNVPSPSSRRGRRFAAMTGYDV